MPSCDAKHEPGLPGPDRIVATARFLADRGAVGIVWLDESLVTVERFGALVADVALGVPLVETVVAFLGLEDDIHALRSRPGAAVSMPAVRQEGRGAGGGLRLNLDIHWMAGEQAFLLVITRAAVRNDLEHAYLAEARLRHMAESEVAAQAQIIRRANAELAIANQDLEAFTSIISHDLRAPLRGIRYATSDAQEALSAGQLETVRDHLSAVSDRTRRMGAMLTGLLDYSRAGRKADVSGPVRLRPIIEDIVDSMRESTGLTIAIAGCWPQIDTIAEPLDIVLRNLVDNAVGHHDRDDGHVDVRCLDRGDALCFEVADDGPGIDPSWHSAIFEPFRRVSDAAGAGGAGIGLALVKKTVERFGGSIAVESDPKRRRGALFRVIWPKTVADDVHWVPGGSPRSRRNTS